MPSAKSVDDYIENKNQWADELFKLREILNKASLEEAIKWGAPCYTYEGVNVVGLGGFKSYFGLWFHQGALLKDTRGLLINAQEGKTKALRQWRMYSAADIKPRIVKAYVDEAIGLAKGRRSIPVERNKRFVVPEPLKSALSASKKLQTAFKALRPGQRREYADYIREAKQDATKLRRIEKITPMILAGCGLNDRYRR